MIDKPVGVAVHPSPGWSGPTVVGHLAARGVPDRHQRRLRAAGHRPAPRRRHLGRDGDLQVRARLLGAQERVPPPHGRQGLPRARPGSSRPARGHDRRPDRPAPEGRLQVRRDGRRPAQRHPLRDPRGAPLRLAARGAPRDRPHPPDPGAHGGPQAPVRRRPHLRRRPRARPAARAGAAVAARRPARLRAPRHRRARRVRVDLPRRPGRTRWRSSAMPTDASSLRPAEPDERRAGAASTAGPRGGVPAMPPAVHTDRRGPGLVRRPARRRPRGLGGRARRRRRAGVRR